jgi:hypothetical protein
MFWILSLWLGSALFLGLAMESNTNRLNLLFLPILFLRAALLDFLFLRVRLIAWGAVRGYVGLAMLFACVYQGGRYSEKSGDAFPEEVVPAFEGISRFPDVPVCVTDQADIAYVYI